MVNKFVYFRLLDLRNGSKAQKAFIDLTYNLLFLMILDLFYKQGYINGYYFITKFKVRIFYKYYNGFSILNGLNFDLRNCYFSYKSLYYLFYFSLLRVRYFYFFSTIYGFYSLEEIFYRDLHVGGVLYFYIKL